MDQNIIYFNHKVTSFNFYTEFLEDLSNFYKKFGSNRPPIFSFEYTEFIDPGVLPNIIGVGLKLKDYHKQPIQLLLNFRPKLLRFLWEARFFVIVGENAGLKIFKYDKNFIGGFDMIPDRIPIDEHVIHRYSPSKEYYKLQSEENQLEFRKNLIYELRDYSLPHDYQPVLQFFERIEESEIDVFLDILSEIISNSILYSLSECFATVFTNKFKTIISLSDIGIGFHKALLKKTNYKFSFSNKLKQTIKDSEELKDFIILFEILNYSQNNNRFNLWALKEIVINKKGVFRLHYNSTQLIFSKKCSVCSKSEDLIECANCFLDNYQSDKKISPLRLFNHTYQGVHIEVELPRGNGYTYD